MSELKQLQQLESNYQLKIIVSLKNEDIILKKMKQIITTILRTKTAESVAINVAGLVFGGVILADGIGLELFAQGGKEILTQVSRRVFFGLAGVAMAQFVDRYNPEDYNDNCQLLDECFFCQYCSILKSSIDIKNLK